MGNKWNSEGEEETDDLPSKDEDAIESDELEDELSEEMLDISEKDEY